MEKKLPIQLDLPEGFLKEEVRNGYTVSSEMKRIWAVELDLLNELLITCKKYGLSIFTDGGTTLGAVRHGGFIPWDDDIDMVMFREDYRKLCQIAESEFKYPYFFQTEYTDPGSMRGHAQLRNSLTTGILSSEIKHRYSFNQGIFIDIFPLDNIPDDKNERDIFFKKIARKRKKAFQYANISTRYMDNPGVKGAIKKILHQSVHTNKNKYFEQFENYIQKYNYRQTEYISKLFFKAHPERLIWKKEWFCDVTYLPFEMFKVPVPFIYEEVLNKFFGDWRTPHNISSYHGGVIFDGTKSYQEYITAYYEKPTMKSQA